MLGHFFGKKKKKKKKKPGKLANLIGQELYNHLS
jgi:hypothetical protein